MVIWHLTSDTPRFPFHVSAGQHVNVQFGTWPIEEGQRTWIDVRIVHPGGTEDSRRAEGTWNFNRDANSYWFVNVGPFTDGDCVEYRLQGNSPAGPCEAGPFRFQVGPKIHLAILWHQHQPMYKNLHAKQARAPIASPGCGCMPLVIITRWRPCWSRIPTCISRSISHRSFCGRSKTTPNGMPPIRRWILRSRRPRVSRPRSARNSSARSSRRTGIGRSTLVPLSRTL